MTPKVVARRVRRTFFLTAMVAGAGALLFAVFAGFDDEPSAPTAATRPSSTVTTANADADDGTDSSPAAEAATSSTGEADDGGEGVGPASATTTTTAPCPSGRPTVTGTDITTAKSESPSSPNRWAYEVEATVTNRATHAVDVSDVWVVVSGDPVEGYEDVSYHERQHRDDVGRLAPGESRVFTWSSTVMSQTEPRVADARISGVYWAEPEVSERC